MYICVLLYYLTNIIMNSADFIQGHAYYLDVVKELSARKYFTVKTSDGKQFSLMKFKFQLNQPLPDSLKCYVKSMYPITLGQDLNHIVNTFYTEGQEYEFIVKSDKKDSDSFYELQDENGLCFKLLKAPMSLTKGNSVRCRVVRISGVNVELKYVGKLAVRLPLDFYSLKQWLEKLGKSALHEYYLRMIEDIPEFEPALDLYDDQDPSWIFELLRITSSHITKWLIECKDDLRNLARVVRRLYLAKHIALYILEGSDYLRMCNYEQRELLQSRLSHYVELFNQYGQAAERILEGTHEEFIDRMFLRLKEAGYLYHPSKQFRIMMTILKLCPELINSRMGELFEALHNWDISNWRTDPFRPALVEQLQIFIEENAAKANQLPANDSSDENKTLIRLILAIAIQRLLATDADNIDLNLNRAMLYRYISYLVPSSVNALLSKGIDSLLGIDFPNEFSWQDTDQPTLLLVKSSHPGHNLEDRSIVTKIYSTSKADVRLTADSIRIIARNADEDSTSIPNSLFDWPVTSIALSEPIQTKNIRKSKDLKVFDQMWKDISWSIFGNTEYKEDKIIEKKEPYDGEEVKIVIDDLRILKYGSEKQRLQFHCTICDEMYKGDGWMPCDAYHMLGWLSYKDIPGNYDGSLNFAFNRDGQPLIFSATVTRKYYGLEFSMKSQIEDYLLENSSSDKELIGIVTYFDRVNNAWLCLTEMGSTFKIYCDESTRHLNEGKLVRVRYVEPERSNSVTQFFVGELSENQDNIPLVIKKSLCLFNLMQSLGEEDEEFSDESFEVRETEEVMKKEELFELIYMYQRRAYTETEYLKAFNYLGIATILCRLAEDDTLLNELTLHMHLLKLLYDFGKNQKIDMADLEKCEDHVSRIPILERLHARLKIVADIEINANSDDLWRISKNPRNETEGKLASLVLSYNMLPLELEKPRKDIMKEISTLLNVNNAASSVKYYGDESQTVEFKSSMIYSSRGGSRPDFKSQIHEILHIICGFMNARGGTLYIGVNDAGYENGLADDLAYRRASGLKATLDGMVVDLQNNIDRKLPVHAKDHCEISIDPESRKGVIVVKVLPVELPVELDGIIYVRSSSTTKPRLDEEREEFIRTRSHNYHLLIKLWGIDQEVAESENEEAASEVQVCDSAKIRIAVSPKVKIEKVDEDENHSGSFSIRIGKKRKNVLHYYEPNYVAPSYYLYVRDDNSFFRSEEDIYYDSDSSCAAAISVKEEENDGIFVVTYDDARVVKFPMQSLLNISPREDSCFRKGVSIKNMAIGKEDDYLLTVVRADYGEIFYRIESLSSLQLASELSDSGETLCDNGHQVLAQEIFSKDKLTLFESDAIGRDRRFYGVPVPNVGGTLTHEERIRELLRPLLELD